MTDHSTEDLTGRVMNHELTHHGVMGMKWGVRNERTKAQYANKGKPKTKRTSITSKIRARQVEGMSKKVGRKVEDKNLSLNKGVLTRNSMKKIVDYEKKADRYKKVRKPGDPYFPWLNASFSRRELNSIIKKMEKNPDLDVNKEVNRRIGRKKAAQAMVLIGELTIAGLALMEAGK